MTLDKSHIDDLEYWIQPPMALAISIPIPELKGYCIYVSAGGFIHGDRPFAEVERNLKNIAANLSLNL